MAFALSGIWLLYGVMAPWMPFSCLGCGYQVAGIATPRHVEYYNYIYNIRLLICYTIILLYLYLY